MTTDRDAILSIVSALGGSIDGVGQRSTDALDRLLDTIAGSDITTNGNATVSDVISTIAQHASGWSQGGGGGGGVTLGSPQIPPYYSQGEPQIGDDVPEASMGLTSLSIGDSAVLTTTASDSVLLFKSYERIAAGVTIVIEMPAEFLPANTDAKIYRATVDPQTLKYSDVELTDTVVTVTDVTIDETAFKRVSFVLPEVEDSTLQVSVLATVGK